MNKSLYSLKITFVLIASMLIIINSKNGFWLDEWSSFYNSNPEKLKDILNNNYKDGSSKFFFIILICWNKLFGYHPESIRLFSNFFGILSIFAFIKLLSEFSNHKRFIMLSLSLFCTNFFLIYYSNEARWYSLSLFFSLMQVIFFIKSIENKKYLFFLLVFSLLSCLINIFSVIIIISQIILCFLKKEKTPLLYSVISLILVFILSYSYVIHLLTDKASIGDFLIQSPFNLNFFIGFYFNNFFGNIFFGAIILILIFFIIFYFNKNLLNNIKINYISLVVFLSYFLPLSYSLFFNPILRDRYIIFVVPLIIIFVSYYVVKIDNKILSKYLTYILILGSFINIKFHKIYFTRPETNKAFEIVKLSNSKNILILNPESHYENYIRYSKYAKNNGINFHLSNNKLEEFWTFCLNNPRFAVVTNEDNKECLKNDYKNTYNLTQVVKVPDIILRLYKKKDSALK